MIAWIKRKARLLHDDSGGASFILITLALPAIFGMASFAVDLGYAYYVKTRLQNAADLAALAGGTLLVSGDKDAVRAKTLEFFNLNIPSGWNGAGPGSISVTPQISIDCSTRLETSGVTCYSKAGSLEKINYVKVDASATTPLFFAPALGFNSASLSAEAVVAGQGMTMPPLNVAIVLDTTKSMEWETTTACGSNMTKVECAKKGALEMVNTLWPTVDKVALYTYPGLSQGTGTIPDDAIAKQNADKNTCTTGTPTVTDYIKDTNPPKYQVIDFIDDYRTKTEPPPVGVLKSSTLVQALGGSTTGYTPSCAGLKTGSPVIYTFYADAIRKAQDDLKKVNDDLKLAGKAERQNVIVILSDGDANAPTFYELMDMPAPFSTGAVAGETVDVIESNRVANQCQNGIDAAQEAKLAGTWVYTIAYSAPTSPNTSCLTDKTSVTKTVTGTLKVCGNSNNSCTTTTINKTGLAPASRYPAPGSSSNTRGSSQSISNCTKNCKAGRTTTNITAGTLSNPNITMSACSAMRSMASSPDKFYSIDAQGSGGCVSDANPTTTNLLTIFKKVASSMMKKRRVPKAAL